MSKNNALFLEKRRIKMDTDNNEMQMSLFDEPKEDKWPEEHV